jgi:hypothetical protein
MKLNFLLGIETWLVVQGVIPGLPFTHPGKGARVFCLQMEKKTLTDRSWDEAHDGGKTSGPDRR